MNMNVRTMKLCAWSGVATLVVMGIGMVMAGFIPPPSPDDSAQEIYDKYIDNKDSIRFGMILSMFAASLLAPFVVIITIQMRRIEGKYSPLAFIQLALGSIFVLEFIYLIFFWQTGTFRTDRSPEEIRLLNDMGWIPFIGLSSTLVLEAAVFGIAIIGDKRERTIFPRWLGYYNLWCATLFTPGTFNVFFKTGPLAWDGLFAFWIPVGVFCSWLVVNSIMLSKAVDHQVEEEGLAGLLAQPNGAPAGSDAALAAEVRALREEVDQLKSSSSVAT